MQACSLSATDIACRRGDRVLFKGLSLSLDGGSAVHITGSNGIGKSSLMRILAGLLRPYAGAVTAHGSVALLDENAALDAHMPLGDGLKFWAEVDGCHETQESADALGIADLLDVPFRYLSTGQKKRSAFTRLLNQDAQIWLLDEPLNGLDKSAQSEVAALIAEHCGQGGICIAASHQPIDLPSARVIALKDFAL